MGRIRLRPHRRRPARMKVGRCSPSPWIGWERRRKGEVGSRNPRRGIEPALATSREVPSESRRRRTGRPVGYPYRKACTVAEGHELYTVHPARKRLERQSSIVKVYAGRRGFRVAGRLAGECPRVRSGQLLRPAWFFIPEWARDSSQARNDNLTIARS